MEDALLDQLCSLARLELSDAERGDFKLKFERLLGFVEQVQSYESPAGEDAEAGLAMHGELEPRRDVPLQFEWPHGTVHDYRVPQVIDFGEGEN